MGFVFVLITTKRESNNSPTGSMGLATIDGLKFAVYEWSSKFPFEMRWIELFFFFTKTFQTNNQRLKNRWHELNHMSSWFAAKHEIRSQNANPDYGRGKATKLDLLMFIVCMCPFASLRFAQNWICLRSAICRGWTNKKQRILWANQTHRKAMMEFDGARWVKVSEWNLYIHGNFWDFHSFPSKRQSIFWTFQHPNWCACECMWGATSNACIQNYDRIQWIRILMNSMKSLLKLHIFTQILIISNCFDMQNVLFTGLVNNRHWLITTMVM